MQRRTLLKASMALTAFGLPAFPAWSAAGDEAETPAEAFSMAQLKKRAQALAASPYQANQNDLPEPLATLDPLDYQKIKFSKDHALWAGEAPIDLRVYFFHTGMQFNTPVRMHVIDDDGMARPIRFSPDMFDYAGSGIDAATLAGQPLGFAGFRMAVTERPGHTPELLSFLGASYFRAVDENRQYGLSARGLAIDTGLPKPEEFPNFTAFWFERPAPDSTTLTVYALLDSPSATGAYKFVIDAEGEHGVVMAIDTHIYTRKAIERLGIGPMTSMFLKGTAQPTARDTINPRIHDSDRLNLWRGNGEWICRPLYNPDALQFNTFADDNPRGFGLVQHDHDFDDYRDSVTWYNRRPSLWLEPTHDWGAGHVALMELPTLGETVDNIVAFWIPEAPVTANDHLHFAYKLYWTPTPPVSPSLAEVDATWSGMGGTREGWIPGDRNPDGYARRFAVDFVGPDLATLAKNEATDRLAVDVSASNGSISYRAIHPLAEIGGVRAVFDWTPDNQDTTPVTLRAYLKEGDDARSVTWLYQFLPPEPADRHY